MNLIDIRETIPRHATRKWKKRKKAPTRIVVHCTGSANQDPNKTARYHVNPNHISKRGCPGLCYSDFIDDAGNVYRCNDYSDITWQAKGLNNSSFGVVLAYEGGNEPPHYLQHLALEQHLTQLCLDWLIPPTKIIGHRELYKLLFLWGKGSGKIKKVCPGMQVDLDGLRTMITIRLQSKLYAEGFFPPNINGKYSKELLKAMRAYAVAKNSME